MLPFGSYSGLGESLFGRAVVGVGYLEILERVRHP